MSIYIKGMEMPTGNDEFRLIIHSNGQVIISHKTHYEEAEAVSVPEHGRLIDADALDDILADQSEDAYNRTHAPRSWERALSAMRDYLDGAPTIIPADKEGE